MKKIYSLLFFAVFLTFNTKASHLTGGEITWKCENNGQYRFFMTVYRDCGGFIATFPFTDHNIDIAGSYLPRDAQNQPFSRILMLPDSTRWLAENSGINEVKCDSSTLISCANRDPGTYEFFYYQSNLVTMNGVPPKSAWTFYWEANCCRAWDYENGTSNSGGQRIFLRAAMYPSKDSLDANPCIDSSPEFTELPQKLFPRGSKVAYFIAAADNDSDSLVYSWGTPFSPPPFNPVPFIYGNGYAFDNPTPDESFHPNNVPSTLNKQIGLVNFAVFSGFGTEKFLMVKQVDAYRDGQKIASIFRENNLYIFNLNMDYVSREPEVFIDNKAASTFKIDVQAGDLIQIPFFFRDKDSLNGQPRSETIHFTPISTPDSDVFADDFSSNSNCGNPPCAKFVNSSLSFDSLENKYNLRGIDTLSTNFEWQTACSNLKGAASKTFHFIFLVSDDACIKSTEVINLEITLHEDIFFSKPEMTCITESKDAYTIEWSPGSVSEFGFDYWEIFSRNDLNSSFALVDTIHDFFVRNYTDFVPWNDSLNKSYLVRAVNSSNCLQSSFSNFSDTISALVRSLEIENLAECIELKWEEPQEFIDSLMERKYFIYRKFSHEQTFQLIDSVINKAVYCDIVEACNLTLNYQVKMAEPFCKISYQTDTSNSKIPAFFVNPFVDVLANGIRSLAPFGSYQWYDCSTQSIISGATERIFIPKDTGTYAVIITQFACRDTSDCIPFFPVGLEEFAFQNSLNLYPNPTSGALNIELAAPESFLMKVYNLHGQLLMHRAFVNENKVLLDLEGDAGIYFIQLTNQKGERANLKVLKR